MTQTIKQEWEEHAALIGKADPLFVEANQSKYPPKYKMQFDWSVIKVTPMVFDANQTPEWNEQKMASELCMLFVAKAHKVLKRLSAADKNLAKRITAVVKRMETEEPSPELLGLYGTYTTAMDQHVEAIETDKVSKQEIHSESEEKLKELAKRYKKVMYSGKSVLYSVENDEWHEWRDCKMHYGQLNIDVLNPDTGKMQYKNIFDAFQSWDKAPSYSRVVFNPKIDGHYDGNFNLWQGISVQPEEGDDDLMLWELLHKICDGNEAYFEYVQKWFAHMVQKPWELPGTALGISGKQGLGKNAFIETFGMLLSSSTKTTEDVMGKVLGRGAYGYYTSYEQVFGQFNAVAAGNIFLFMDEATWGGFHGQKSMTKTAITGNTVLINEKNMKALTVQNYRRFVFASNENFYYGADADDRRLLPLEFKEELRPSVEWFKEFYDTRANGKMLQNLAHRLKNVDIENWNPMKALRELEITTGTAIQQDSAPDYQQWMDDVADTGTILLEGNKDIPELRVPVCGRRISEDELRRAYQNFAGQNELRGWRKADFVKARDQIFGNKRQDKKLNIYFRVVPEQAEMQRRLDAQYKWKRNRFNTHSVDDIAEEKGKLLQFPKTA